MGGVALNIRTAAEAAAAAQRLSALSETLLVEEMIGDGVAEVLVGVIRDPQFGQVLVLGAGGVLTELLADSVDASCRPSRRCDPRRCWASRSRKLLDGFRGKPAGDVEALGRAVPGIARYAAANIATLLEIDVNPVIVRPAGRARSRSMR